MPIPIVVNKEQLVVTLNKDVFDGRDIALFRYYGFKWKPDGSIDIQIRGTTKQALKTTIKSLFPYCKREWAPEYYDKIMADIKEAYQMFEEGFDKHIADKSVDRPVLNLYSHPKIFAHQREGIRFQCYQNYTMLSFEQGLGKSFTALLPSLILNTPVTLIIVPNSLKYNWLEEMTDTWQDRFGYSVPKEQISVLSAGNKSITAKGEEKYIIINYDMVEKYYEYLLEKNIKRVIIDECHYIKNRDAKRTRSIKSLVFKLNSGGRKCSVSFLSGTPAPNRIVDIYSYLEIARHPHGQDYKRFLSNFCYTAMTRFGVKVTDGKNLDVLARDVQNLMIRKLKSECLDLPSKSYIKITFENEEYDRVYQEAWNALLEIIIKSNGKKSAESLSAMNVLQIITAKAKVKPCIELAEEIMSDVYTHTNGTTRLKKVAIMCNFKEPLYMLKEYFKEKCVLLDGSVASEKRMELVNAFKKVDDVQVFLGQTTAAGVGLNLTECNDVIFLNFPYTRAEIEQASDRFHRIGQDQPVTVYFTVLKGKIDEMIYRLIVKKYRDISKLIDGVVDNTETVDVGDEILDMFAELKMQLLSEQQTEV